MTPDNSAEEAILLVDDNPTNLQLLFETLDGRGYKLLIAKDGNAALLKLRAALLTPPQIIILGMKIIM